MDRNKEQSMYSSECFQRFLNQEWLDMIRMIKQKYPYRLATPHQTLFSPIKSSMEIKHAMTYYIIHFSNKIEKNMRPSTAAKKPA